MTLIELISKGLIKDGDQVSIEIRHPDGRAACVWKGKWFTDYIKTDIELDGVAWNRETGWRLHGTAEEGMEHE